MKTFFIITISVLCVYLLAWEKSFWWKFNIKKEIVFICNKFFFINLMDRKNGKKQKKTEKKVFSSVKWFLSHIHFSFILSWLYMKFFLLLMGMEMRWMEKIWNNFGFITCFVTFVWSLLSIFDYSVLVWFSFGIIWGASFYSFQLYTDENIDFAKAWYYKPSNKPNHQQIV